MMNGMETEWKSYLCATKELKLMCKTESQQQQSDFFILPCLVVHLSTKHEKLGMLLCRVYWHHFIGSVGLITQNICGWHLLKLPSVAIKQLVRINVSMISFCSYITQWDCVFGDLLTSRSLTHLVLGKTNPHALNKTETISNCSSTSRLKDVSGLKNHRSMCSSSWGMQSCVKCNCFLSFSDNLK